MKEGEKEKSGGWEKG